MTDRELLEAAARAAGIVGKWSDRGQCILVTNVAGMPDTWWRPQDDNGDALWLAVRLGMQVCPGCARDADGNLALSDATDDVYAATRDAIVMAAAEIGRAMK